MEDNNTFFKTAADNAVLDRISPVAKPLFYRVPVLCSESRTAYLQIVDSVASTIHPDDDIMKWIFVMNIVDHIYNILFLRQVATGIVDIKRMAGLKSLLSSLLRETQPRDVGKYSHEFCWTLNEKVL